MKKTLLFLALTIVVLGSAVAPVGGRAARAQETPPPPPPDMYMLTASTCLALAGAPGITGCVSMLPGSSIIAQKGVITGSVLDRDGNGAVTRSEASGFDGFTAHQMHSTDGVAIVLFVGYNHPVTFVTNRGTFQMNASGSSLAQTFICDSPESGGITDTLVNDTDCVTGGPAGDGLVYAHLVTNGTAYGSGTVTAKDSNSGEILATLDFTVVGAGRTAAGMKAFETTVQSGAVAEDCTFPASTAGFLAALADPKKTVIIVTVKDINGDDVAGSWVHVTVDDPSAAMVALPDAPTLDLGTFGIGAPNIVCGLDGPATVKVTAKLQTGPPAAGTPVDVNATPGSSASADIAVRGDVATVDLVADPVTQACDGVATTTITATVKDANGDLAAGGVPVHFDVQVRGSANPVNGKTNGDGVASSVVTPLAISDTGVPVVVTAGEVQQSVLIRCAAAAPPPPSGVPAAPQGGAGAAPGVIVGPDTGSGPMTAGGTGSLSYWPVLLLVSAALALAAGRRLFARIEPRNPGV